MLADRVLETSTTTGTGPIELDGAASIGGVQMRTFVAGVGDGNPCRYMIENSDGTEYEKGFGTVSAGSPDQISRDVVLGGSDGPGVLVDFSAGQKRVYVIPDGDAIRFGVGELPTAGGSANARTIAYKPACTALRAGLEFWFINGAADNTSTTPTVQVDSNAAKTVVRGDGSAVQAGDLKASALIGLMYDGTSLRLVSAAVGLQPVAAADTSNQTLTAADVGKVRRATGAVQYTLPAASAVANGAAILVKSLTEKSVTIVRAGADTIEDSLTTVRLASFETIELTSDGTALWVITRQPAWQVGDTKVFWTTALPKGWAWVNAQALSRTDQGGLFAAIATTYGAGDGSTTFNVPDVLERVIAGNGAMGGVASPGRLTNSGTGNPGIDGDTLGAAGGVDRHTLTGAQSGTSVHGHAGSTTTALRPTGGPVAQSGGDFGVPDTPGAVTVANSSAAAASEAHPIAQPTIVGNLAIKT